MGGDYNCSESIWMDEFEKGRSVKDSYSYVPRGERKAGETLNQYHFKKVPEPPREYQKIVGKVLNEDLITGMKKRESLCMNCGRVFRDEVAGFARRCETWLLNRGSDDTTQKLAESCRKCGSDNPKKIARAMYEKVCGHGMTSFEAAEAVCNCIAQNVDNKSI